MYLSSYFFRRDSILENEKNRKNTYTVRECSRAFGQSYWRGIKAAIQIFKRLQTATYITFDLLEIRSQITYKKTVTVIAFVLENHIVRDKYVKKILNYTFKINQITLTYGERKKERPNFDGMFSQNLPISAASTIISKMKLP